MLQLLKCLFVFALPLSFSVAVNAQYTFEMMNGRMLEVFSYNDTDYVDIKVRYNKRSRKMRRIESYNENLRFELAEKRGESISKVELDSLVEKMRKPLPEPRIKSGFFDSDEVFAIHKPGAERDILYEHNEVLGNYYTVPEMQEFIVGERDAIMRFKGNRAFWGGVAFGAVGGFAWQNSVFSLTTPLVWTGIVAIPVIRIKDKYMSNPAMKTEPYKAGFAKTARTKNMLQGLKGSVIGTAAGILIYTVLANNTSTFR